MTSPAAKPTDRMAMVGQDGLVSFHAPQARMAPTSMPGMRTTHIPMTTPSDTVTFAQRLYSLPTPDVAGAGLWRSLSGPAMVEPQ